MLVIIYMFAILYHADSSAPTLRLVALAISIRLISSWIPSIFWDLVFSRVLKQEMIRNWASWCCSLSSENLPVLPRLFSSCHTSGAWFLTSAITWSMEKLLKWVMVSGPWYAAFWDDNKLPICGSKQGERAEEATCSCSWATCLSNSSIRFCITWSLTCWSSTWSLSRRFSASKSSEEEHGVSVISSNPKICFVLVCVPKRLDVFGNAAVIACDTW